MPMMRRPALLAASRPSAGPAGRKGSGLDKGQQIGINGVGVSGRHTVRETRVRLQRAVLYQFDRTRTRGGVRDDLVGVTVHHKDRHYCGRLPLALAHAGVRAAACTGVPLGDTIEALQHAGVGVDQAFACSYRELSASAAHLFRTLATALDPGSDITAEEATALMTTSLPAARRLLDELCQVGLLQEIRPGRYDWHILVRAYAAGLPTPDRRRPHAGLCRSSTANAVIDVHSKIAAGVGVQRGCSRR
jgi:hypothetical protein